MPAELPNAYGPVEAQVHPLSTRWPKSAAVLAVIALGACAPDQTVSSTPEVQDFASAARNTVDYSSLSLSGEVSLKVGTSTKLSVRTSSRSRGSIKWLSSNPNAATVNSQGNVTGKAVGSAYVTASGFAVNETYLVSVTPAYTLTSFTVSPSTGTALAPGQTRQFSTQQLWSDGQARNFGVTYTATGGSISSSGLFTAGSVAGSFMVIANCLCGALDTAFVTVDVPAQLTKITVSPKTVSLNAGATQQFGATANWSTGATTLPPITWSATGGSISTGGLYTAPTTAGTYQVIVAHSGGTLRDTAVVTVTGGGTSSGGTKSLASLNLGPSEISVQAGASVQFSVSPKWNDGTSAQVSVGYSANVGAIDYWTGRYTAPTTAGRYSVYVEHRDGSLRDTSIVVVSASAPFPPPPTSGNSVCPNEPAGYSKYADFTLPGMNPPTGWEVLGVDRELHSDASAPYASTSLAFKHEAGRQDGQIGILSTTPFASAPKHVFSCTIFKQSANYVQHPSGTKFIYTPQNGSNTRPIQFQMMPLEGLAVGGKFRWRMEMQTSDTQKLYEDNVTPSQMTPGRWYRLEFLVAMNTPGIKNGTLIWWTSEWNGSAWSAPVMNAYHKNVLVAESTFPGSWLRWEYNLYYGGGPLNTLTADQYLVFNRVYLSTSN